MPLTGIRVLDLTRLLPFGYGSMLLADMGAEVIKIEEPLKGDYMRWIPPLKRKESYAFLSVNRNKKSIILDLRKEKGKEIFFQLARSADVIFESFRPGVVKRLGIDFESIQGVNPKLIYCSCTGYGQTGPYSQRVGHDINYLGVSGILGITGRHTGRPVVPGVPIADMTSGVFCALSICAALVGRTLNNEGHYIDISMTDCIASYMHAHSGLLANEKAQTLPITGGNPRYETFETKDGNFITLGNVEDKFWFNFCDLIGREDFKAYGFDKGKEKDEIMKELRIIMQTRTRKEWLELFEGKEICYGPVNNVGEIPKDPQLEHREMYYEIEHPNEGKTLQIGMPIKFSDRQKRVAYPAPRLGEHTENILREIGYTIDEINTFRDLSVI